MKSLVYLLGLLALGYIGYNLVTKKDGETDITDPVQNLELQTQPQQLFPMQKVETPRVDNADQPWYGGDRGFFGLADDILQASGLGGSSSGSIMNYNTDQIWSELNQKYMQ